MAGTESFKNGVKVMIIRSGLLAQYMKEKRRILNFVLSNELHLEGWPPTSQLPKTLWYYC